jgi:hypothetical protein
MGHMWLSHLVLFLQEVHLWEVAAWLNVSLLVLELQGSRLKQVLNPLCQAFCYIPDNLCSNKTSLKCQ